MNVRTTLVLGLLAVLAGTQHACKQGDPARVAAIDSLIVRTDSLLGVLNAIDLPVYQHMDSVYRTQRDWIEKQFTDTIDKPAAVALGNYQRAMSKSLNRVLKHHGELKKDLAYSREQLVDLRHDVDRGLLHPNPKETYFGQERLVLEQLTHSVDVVRTSAGTAMREWEKHHVEVERLKAAADSTANVY